MNKIIELKTITITISSCESCPINYTLGLNDEIYKCGLTNNDVEGSEIDNDCPLKDGEYE